MKEMNPHWFENESFIVWFVSLLYCWHFYFPGMVMSMMVSYDKHINHAFWDQALNPFPAGSCKTKQEKLRTHISGSVRTDKYRLVYLGIKIEHTRPNMQGTCVLQRGEWQIGGVWTYVLKVGHLAMTFSLTSIYILTVPWAKLKRSGKSSLEAKEVV